VSGSSSSDAANQAVEEVARTSYGRLVAYLASTTSDLAAAEDAVADAFEAALRTWPERGIPDRPTSWMITAARRSLIGRARRAGVAERALSSLALQQADRAEPGPASAVGDHRLELMFACAHPAIEPGVHAPLMLQTVLGLDVERMAQAFRVRPATLGQRLVRAKRKIRTAGIPFATPDRHDLEPRAAAVLDAIYVAFGTGWEDPLGADAARAGLAEEAIRLAELVCELLPTHAEAHGLAALVLHSHSRRAARRDELGRMVSLSEQDTRRWSPDLVERGDGHLSAALALRSPGPYQLHGAIQSFHNRRASTGFTDWTAIAAMYDALVDISPTTGARVARAAAHLEAVGPSAARTLLDELDPSAVADYQPYWAVLAEVLRRLDVAEAELTAARARALELADPAVSEYLRVRYGATGRPPEAVVA